MPLFTSHAKIKIIYDRFSPFKMCSGLKHEPETVKAPQANMGACSMPLFLELMLFNMTQKLQQQSQKETNGLFKT